MSKTLKELRNSPAVGPATMIYPLCLAGNLTEKLQEIDAALADLPERDPDDKKPRRMAEKDPRTELEVEREAIRAEMADHLSPVVLRAKASTVWAAWIAENPPREDDNIDALIDCNLDALIAALPEHVATVGGEPLAPGDWEFVTANASLGDLREMAYLVSQMQFGRIAVPKSLTASPVDPPSVSE